MSNKIYEKNMNALDKRSPRTTSYIRDKIKAFETDKDAKPVLDDTTAFPEKGMFEDIDIIVESGYDGTPVFKVNKDGKEVYLTGKRDPNKLAKVWTEKFDMLPRTSPILLFGIGNGSLLLEIDKKIKYDMNIFLYEPSLKIFLKCLHEVDLSEVFLKRTVLLGIDDNVSYDQISDTVSTCVDMANLEFMQRYINPGYARLYPKEVKKFLELARDSVNDIIVNHATRYFFSNLVAPTALFNAMFLPDCNTTYQLVDVIPRDIPAIVVAAGPSLDKNIQDLKLAQNKAFIIAVDTALRPLLKAGIVPDMFAMVDAVKPLGLVNIPGAEKIPLVTSMVSSQEVMAFHTGKKFIFDERFRFINKPFEDMGIDFMACTSGGSVATLAFALMYMIGIDTIIFVGQDLALTGKKTHAAGTYDEGIDTEGETEEEKKKTLKKYGNEGEVDTEGMRMVPGNVEEMVPTRGDFYIYLEWYENYIKGIKEYRNTLRVINATEGGAKIKGTEIMTLKEAIKESCKREVDIKGLIDGIPPIFAGDKRKKVVDYLRGIEAGFRKISQNAFSQVKLYKKMENMTKTGGISMKEYRALLEKLKKLNKEIIKSPLYQLIEWSLIDAKTLLEKELLIEENSILAEAKEISRKGLIYMDLVSQCSLLLADVAASSLSQVK